MSGPSPPKKSKSSVSGSGGFTLLRELAVRWDLPNFKKRFLESKSNLFLLHQQHFDFIVEELEEYPMMKWRLSLVAGPPPRREEEPFYKNIGSSGDEDVDYPDDWLISLKFDLLTPVADLEGLYVCVESNLKRDPVIAATYPEDGMVGLGGPNVSSWRRRLLPLCTVVGRADVLRVNWLFGRSDLQLRPKFEFYTTNVRIPEKPSKSEDEWERRRLEDTAREQLKNFVSREGSDEVILIANDGTEFLTYRDLLRARSSKFNKILTEEWKDGEKCHCLALNYDPGVVGWMLHYLETCELQPFIVKKEEGSGDVNPLPPLSELVRFAVYYELHELFNYFDLIKVPELCIEDPSLARDLKQLANQYGMEHSKEKINMIMKRDGGKKGWFG